MNRHYCEEDLQLCASAQGMLALDDAAAALHISRMAYDDFHSSGNLAADRRYAYAQDLFKDGEFAQAIDLYEQTLELAPQWAACWFGLGEALTKNGQATQAVAAFRKVLTLSPQDPFGAGLHLLRLGETAAENQNAYVTQLFDQYAPRFDMHLVSALNYRGPEILREHLAELAPPPHVFEHFIDLGCGTGLMARALAGRFVAASGVDLSGQMIKQAEKTALYGDLHVGDMLAYLQSLPENSADLVLAADVFVYVGALEPLFDEIHRVLRQGGLFGFSVQRHEGAGFVLGQDLRFAHSDEYLRDISASFGFKVLRIAGVSTRQDQGRDVPGLIAYLD